MSLCAQLLYLIPMWIGVLAVSFSSTCNRGGLKDNEPSAAARTKTEKLSRETTESKSSEKVIPPNPRKTKSSVLRSSSSTLTKASSLSKTDVEIKANHKIECREQSEALFTAPYPSISSKSTRLLKTNSTQPSPPGSNREIRKAHKKRRRSPTRKLVDEDGTLHDAPSLERVETSVDSDLGSLRSTVQRLVKARPASKCTSSILGVELGEGGNSTDTGDLIDRALSEEAAYERRMGVWRGDSKEELRSDSEEKKSVKPGNEKTKEAVVASTQYSKSRTSKERVCATQLTETSQGRRKYPAKVNKSKREAKTFVDKSSYLGPPEIRSVPRSATISVSMPPLDPSSLQKTSIQEDEKSRNSGPPTVKTSREEDKGSKQNPKQ